MDNRIRLRLLGLSYAQLKNSAFMLILSEVGGPRHLNIWIGEAEAHSIAIAMEGIKPPRPLTHDLFASFIHGFGVKLVEVFIYRVDDEVFSSELTFTDGERTITIDSRTSDAVAIAMRTGAPIYTTPEIMEQKGFLLDITQARSSDELEEDDTPEEAADREESQAPDHDNDLERNLGYSPRLENYAIEELERTLEKLIEAERYEEAARVNEILQRKKSSR